MLNKVIKSFRLVNDFTVNEVSNLTGLSAIYIGELERGIKKNASEETLLKLANGFNVSLSFMKEVIEYGNFAKQNLEQNSLIDFEQKDRVLSHLLSYKILDYYLKQKMEHDIYLENLVKNFDGKKR